MSCKMTIIWFKEIKTSIYLYNKEYFTMFSCVVDIFNAAKVMSSDNMYIYKMQILGRLKVCDH